MSQQQNEHHIISHYKSKTWLQTEYKAKEKQEICQTSTLKKTWQDMKKQALIMYVISRHSHLFPFYSEGFLTCLFLFFSITFIKRKAALKAARKFSFFLFVWKGILIIFTYFKWYLFLWKEKTFIWWRIFASNSKFNLTWSSCIL